VDLIFSLSNLGCMYPIKPVCGALFMVFGPVHLLNHLDLFHVQNQLSGAGIQRANISLKKIKERLAKQEVEQIMQPIKKNLQDY
jgi:hypothetical protein